MNKDVIYIDVDDDVTAIIGKIKASQEKVVALVPPKRAGALQSAVNLRLLDRMAKTSKKHLVLITNNAALVALAGNAQIPVAKNLQSKPELAEIPALVVDDDDDIIDGSELPVGDHAKTSKIKNQAPDEPRSEVVETIDLNLSDEDEEYIAPKAGVAAVAAKPLKKKGKSKIPNFDTFRKKLLFGIAGGVALVGLLVWMFVFAPAATVIITASTSPVPVSTPVRLGGTAATDFKTGVIRSSVQQEKKDVAVEFEATGQKDVGEKATGSLKVSRLSQTDTAVPAGSVFTSSGGQKFATQSAVTIPASVPCFPTYCAQSATVSVTAVASGESSNGVTGSSTGPNGTTGVFQSATSGGTTKVAKVVSADDIERARGQLIGQSPEAAKTALIKLVPTNQRIIDSSFSVERGDAVSTPAVDQEAPASGKASLSIPTTYTIHAVPTSDLETFLRQYIEAQTPDIATQKVYSTGIDKAALANFRKAGEAISATVTATGRIGPKIDESAIKEQVKGKIYGEVQQTLQAMPGIKDVDVEFSYFWVRSVPNNTDKIRIEFKLEDE